MNIKKRLRILYDHAFMSSLDHAQNIWIVIANFS